MKLLSTKNGFSLIELLMVLAIVSILVSVTLPSYSHYIYKARRADAIAALLQIQLAQEQWRVLHGVYSNNLSELGVHGNKSGDGWYVLKLKVVESGNWLATASPQGPQSGDQCAPLAIDMQGPIYGGPYAKRTCWNR